MVLFAISVGKTASAASRFELTWSSSSVAKPCLSQEDIKQAVIARLKRDPFVPVGEGEIAIEGKELPARAGQLRARIVQRDREGRVLGTRDLDATSCGELRRSANFVVFLIVDPDAAFRGPATEPPVETPSDEQREVETPPTNAGENVEKVAPPSPSEPRATRRPLVRSSPSYAPAQPPTVDLGLALIVSNGLLPKPDVGPALTLGLVPLALPLRFEWRASYRSATSTVQGYDFGAVEQQWRACWIPRLFGPLFGTTCGGATWTAILPEARGLARGDQAPKTVMSPTVAAGPAFEIGDTRVSGDLAMMLPWPRYAFTYREDGRAMPLHEVSRIVWSFGIGVSRSFR